MTTRSIARAYASTICLAAGCLVLSLVATLVTVRRHEDALAFRRQAIAATGIVVELDNRFGGAATDDVIVVELVADVGLIRARVVVDTVADYEEGDQITVLYAPQHPERAVLPDLEFPVRGTTFAIVTALSALILLGMVASLSIRVRRASRSGAANSVRVQVGERARSVYPLLLTAPDGQMLELPVSRSQLASVRERMTACGELRRGRTVFLRDGDVVVFPSGALRSAEA